MRIRTKSSAGWPGLPLAHLLWCCIEAGELEIDKIAPISPKNAGAALPFFEKTILGILGIQDFAKMWRAA